MRSFRKDSWRRGLITGSVVFLLCLGAGIISGTLFKKSEKPTQAASASITVTDNNQVVNEDKSTGTTTIHKTSTVTVKDSSADKGYLLSAKLSQTNLPGITTTISSDSPAAIHCTEQDPCTITDTTTKPILYPIHNNNATTSQGETTTLDITITIPAGTDLGQYILDIEYQEQAVTPLQDIDETNCTEARDIAYDARNSEIYYIQKIPGTGQNNTDLCWMETNLRYAGDGNYDSSWGYPDDRYATATTNTTANTNDNARPLTLRSSGTATYTSAEYMNPGGSTDYTNTTTNGGFYGYLYNWCAAMGGQANACNNTSTSGFDTAQSICPAGWRLPTGTNTGEFNALNTAINGGSTTSDAGLRTNFLAIYSGAYDNSLRDQGGISFYWSSMTYDAYYTYGLGFSASAVGSGAYDNKYYGMAVRCVKDVIPIPTTTYGAMQTMTNAQCSTTRGTAYDARNNQVYYVQKIGSLCWMESNLRYAGDGNYDSAWGYTDDRYATTTALAANTANPNDNTRPLTTVSGTSAYEVAQLANPGGSTDYTNTAANGGFYGYLYNWCSAMGGQADACQGSAATQPNQTESICPAGWRLPTGGSAGEFNSLNTAINGGAANTDAGLRTNFLAVYSGYYNSGLVNQGSSGIYWNSSVVGATSAYNLNFYASYVSPANYSSKNYGFAVRCVF